jgi:DNA adenine methylase
MMHDTAPEATPIIPFLKWAGGKRWFVQRALERMPRKFDRYVEPFLGGAAVYFALRPKAALLADTNARLIETYEAVQSDWSRVDRELKRHQAAHSRDYYYLERERSRRTAFTRAAQFIYLNRTCWNGLYRVNLNGTFNVPIGTKTAVVLDTDDFEEVSTLLSGATLKCCDFEEVLDECARGDFVFVDPPYTVKHNMNGFIKYNEKLFSWDDQVRLRDAVARAADRYELK